MSNQCPRTNVKLMQKDIGIQPLEFDISHLTLLAGFHPGAEEIRLGGDETAIGLFSL